MPDVTGPAGDGVESSTRVPPWRPAALLVCNECEDVHARVAGPGAGAR